MLQMETMMSELKKADCISLENAMKELGVVRNTLNSYCLALGVTKHKFPLDRRGYITKVDFERVRDLVRENQQ